MTAGVVCSTWSVVNRGTSGRTAEDPLGNVYLGFLYKVYDVYDVYVFLHM